MTLYPAAILTGGLLAHATPRWRRVACALAFGGMLAAVVVMMA
jgi:hypothetical protein